jgi:hypothetical protein
MSTGGGRLALSNEAHPNAEVRHGTIPKAGGSAILSGDSPDVVRDRERSEDRPVPDHGLSMTGISTTLIGDPSIALTS